MYGVFAHLFYFAIAADILFNLFFAFIHWFGAVLVVYWFDTLRQNNKHNTYNKA